MSNNKVKFTKKRKWYNKDVFPLIPILTVKKEDEHNTGGFSFKWLFITIWTLEYIEFEFAFTISTHWGFGFIGLLPFLRWVVTIPCPPKLGIWFDKKFSRKVKMSNDHDTD